MSRKSSSRARDLEATPVLAPNISGVRELALLLGARQSVRSSLMDRD